MVNDTDSSDTHEYVVTGPEGVNTSGLTPGASYTLTYRDNNTTYNSTYPDIKTYSLVVAEDGEFTLTQGRIGEQYYLEGFNYGVLQISYSPSITGQEITYEVIASDNSLVAVGSMGSIIDDGLNYRNLPSVNSADPTGYWPVGNYRLRVTTPCGSAELDAEVLGYDATLAEGETSPVCGGFNYAMKGNFKEPISGYEVIVVSGPSAVGQVRNLASTTASLPFNALAFGTYTFGLRLKGSTTVLLSETITFNAADIIIIDQAATGGFVCTAGDNSGILTIVAISNSPEPYNVLQYSIIREAGGSTFSPPQDSNQFTGLTNRVYTYKITDGCGNEVTRNAQVGLGSTPVASANGINNPAEICRSSTGSIQLDVAYANGYLWSGPGISSDPSSPAYQGLKSPVVQYSELALGLNEYECVLDISNRCGPGASSIARISITLNPEVDLVITDPEPVCAQGSVDITAAAVTAGNEAGLTFAYFEDAEGTIPLANPEAVTNSGTYYIQTTNASCNNIKPVVVTIIDALVPVTISYPNANYCNRGTAAVTLTVDAGGTFVENEGVYSGDANLIIDPDTGEIDLANSTVGTHTVTYTYGPSACSETATATITINETVLPEPLTDVLADCSVVSLDAPTLTDTCSGIITGTTTTNFPITTQGTTIVTWTFDYGNGYIQTVDQNVIINNTTAPVVPVLADVVAECSVTVPAPRTTDTCGNVVTGATTDPLIYDVQGTFVITWTFTDAQSNSVTATQNVIINNTTAPVVPVLADIVAECMITVESPTTTDACGNEITGTTTDPLTYDEEGTFVITWTFTDAQSNSVTATQNIILETVTEFVAPTLADITADCSATVPVATTTDACGNEITGVTTDPLTYNVKGNYVITWTFTDTLGHSVIGTQNVIINNTTAPVVPILADIIAECSAIVPVPTTVDTCGATITGTTTDPLTYDAQGNYVINWTFTDANANVTTTTQNVIINDVTAPNLVTSIQEEITVNCDAVPTVPTLEFSDNCIAPSLIDVVFTETESDIVNGTYQITRNWVASDLANNQRSISQTITVLLTDYFRTTTTKAYCNNDSEEVLDINALINAEFPGMLVSDGTFSGDISAMNSNGIFNPEGLPNGNYVIRYENNDTVCPKVVEIVIPVDDSICPFVAGCQTLVFHNAISLNGDSTNDAFVIENITDFCHSDNILEIYNRWGVKVFDAVKYGSSDNLFRGYSQGRSTVKQSSTLPEGTYYYILKYKSPEESNYKTKASYLYISGGN